MKSSYILLISTSLMLSALTKELIKFISIDSTKPFKSVTLFEQGVLLEPRAVIGNQQSHQQQTKAEERKTHSKIQTHRSFETISTVELDESSNHGSEKVAELEESSIQHEKDEDEKLTELFAEEESPDGLIAYVTGLNPHDPEGIRLITKDKDTGLFTIYHNKDKSLEKQKFKLANYMSVSDLAVIELKLMKKTVNVNWGVVLEVYNSIENKSFRKTLYATKNYLELEPKKKNFKLPEFFKTPEVEAEIRDFEGSKYTNYVMRKKLLIKAEFKFLQKIQISKISLPGRKWFHVIMTFNNETGHSYEHAIKQEIFLNQQNKPYDFFKALCGIYHCVNFGNEKINRKRKFK
jgi:hypothetical protein